MRCRLRPRGYKSVSKEGRDNNAHSGTAAVIKIILFSPTVRFSKLAAVMKWADGKLHKRAVPALSLDRFANAKVTKYDKRKVIERARALKAKRVTKYKKLQKRLEVEGRLQAGIDPEVSDASVSAPRPSCMSWLHG